jgi:hypothetical protein
MRCDVVEAGASQKRPYKEVTPTYKSGDPAKRAAAGLWK